MARKKTTPRRAPPTDAELVKLIADAERIKRASDELIRKMKEVAKRADEVRRISESK